MVKSHQDKFLRGQLVAWKKNADKEPVRKKIATLRKQLGIGPFYVGSVKHSEDPKKAWHSQIITLRYVDDNLQRVFFEKSEWFSGAFFQVWNEGI